jgi:hypothetical protein
LKTELFGGAEAAAPNVNSFAGKKLGETDLGPFVISIKLFARVSASSVFAVSLTTHSSAVTLTLISAGMRAAMARFCSASASVPLTVNSKLDAP